MRTRSGSVANWLLILLGAGLIALSAAVAPWARLETRVETPRLEISPEPSASEIAAAEEAARKAEEERRQRISELEGEIRQKVTAHARADALRLGLALRDLEAVFDEYESGVGPFVEELHSLGGRGRLLLGLGRDASAVPGTMARSTSAAWDERIEGQVWRTLRDGQILEIVAEAVKSGYGLPRVEELVGGMWEKAFEERVDLGQRVADRIDRLAGEFEASRNRLAREIEGPFLELIRLQGLSEVAVDAWLTRQLEAQVTERAGEMAVQTIGAEILAFGGGELAAYQTLQITRRLANKAAEVFARRMAGTVLARTGGTLAAGVGSSWATFGVSLAVAVVVEVGFNEVSKQRMEKELRENMREFRAMFREGTEEAPGVHPQLVAAFVEYQRRIVEVFDHPSESWSGDAETTVALGPLPENRNLDAGSQEKEIVR